MIQRIYGSADILIRQPPQILIGNAGSIEDHNGPGYFFVGGAKELVGFLDDNVLFLGLDSQTAEHLRIMEQGGVLRNDEGNPLSYPQERSFAHIQT